VKTFFSIGHAVLAALFAALGVLLTIVTAQATWAIAAQGLGESATVPLIEGSATWPLPWWRCRSRRPSPRRR
jgi:hypothetical protein